MKYDGIPVPDDGCPGGGSSGSKGWEASMGDL